MPIHDWSRVNPGIFHAFHVAWVSRLQDSLNSGILPSDFYVLAEQTSGDVQPDVLTLQETNGREDDREPGQDGTLLVTDAPPRVWQTTSYDSYVRKRRTLSIHSTSDDRIVALIEIVSPENKSGVYAFDQFVDKALSCFDHRLHLLIVDLHKPTKRDPQGGHGAIIEAFDGSHYESPPDKKLTLVAYDTGGPLKAYIQPVAVGDSLPDMPLFLSRGRYVNVPLEETYQAAFQGLPRIYKQQLTAN